MTSALRPGIAAVALLLAACNAQPSATPSSSATTPSVSSPPITGPSGRTPTRPAATVPDIWKFDAARVGGGTIDGTDFAGDKVAVWLWAPW